jgi:hypothetical protein
LYVFEILWNISNNTTKNVYASFYRVSYVNISWDNKDNETRYFTWSTEIRNTNIPILIKHTNKIYTKILKIIFYFIIFENCNDRYYINFIFFLIFFSLHIIITFNIFNFDFHFRWTPCITIHGPMHWFMSVVNETTIF